MGKRAYGLARCVWRGLDHFRAYVRSSVVAYTFLNRSRSSSSIAMPLLLAQHDDICKATVNPPQGTVHTSSAISAWGPRTGYHQLAAQTAPSASMRSRLHEQKHAFMDRHQLSWARARRNFNVT